MKLKKLILRNIRSYNHQEVSFPEGSVLLSGEIGSGKTTLLLAIEYALFGLQPGQKGSALLRNGSDLGEVSLEFEVQGKMVRIDRKLKRTTKSISNEYAAITIDGEMIETSVTELKTKVLELLGYPNEFVKKNNLLYRYTVYTPQEEMKQIILEDAETRLNVLRHVFGIDKYKRIRENLEVVLFHMREQTRTMQVEIKDLERDQADVQAKEQLVSALEDKAREKNSELLDKIQMRKEKENEIKEIEGKIREKENLEREVEKTKIVVSSKKDMLASILREKQDLDKSLKQMNFTFSEAEYSGVIADLSARRTMIEQLHTTFIETSSMLASLEQQILESKSKMDRVFKIDFCPTCLQDVSDFHKHNITHESDREIAEIRKKIEILKVDKHNSLVALEKAREERAKFEDRKMQLEIARSKLELLERSRVKVEELSKTQNSLEKDITLLMKHSDGLKAEILRFSIFDARFRAKQDELKEAFKSEKNTEIVFAEIKKEIELTKRFIAEIRLKIVHKEKLKEKLVALQEMNDWMSTHFVDLIDFTERNILLKLRREFSNLFNSWFHVLAGDLFEVRLDENFTPLIMQGETEMDYTFLSGGERTSLALAYRLALNQIINSLMSKICTKSLVILDEPTDGFSETQVEKMRDVFDQLDVEQLIIVSHDQKIEGFVDHILRLRKDEGFSVVEQAEV
jgi:DNA repair protein SbcC/Rad50